RRRWRGQGLRLTNRGLEEQPPIFRYDLVKDPQLWENRFEVLKLPSGDEKQLKTRLLQIFQGRQRGLLHDARGRQGSVIVSCKCQRAHATPPLPFGEGRGEGNEYTAAGGYRSDQRAADSDRGRREAAAARLACRVNRRANAPPHRSMCGDARCV